MGKKSTKGKRWPMFIKRYNNSISEFGSTHSSTYTPTPQIAFLTKYSLSKAKQIDSSAGEEVALYTQNHVHGSTG